MIPDIPALRRFIRRQALPGLVVAGFDRKGVQTRAVGFADQETGTLLTESSPFPIASVTKTFTVDLVLQAASNGEIDLDQPIRDQLSGFTLADPEATARLTPRDALCHFSGLPPHTWAWVYGDRPRREFIRERLPHLASVGPFRERHRYSNLMYAVLGELLRSKTGHSWERFLTGEVLVPLGLSDLRPLDARWMDPGVCPYRLAGDRPLRMPPFVARAGHPVAPAGELQGSVPCLAAWGRHHLGLDQNDPRWRPHNRVSGDRPHPCLGPLDYGLGWRIDTVNGDKRVWHSGQCGGFSSLLTLYPEHGRGLAVCCNRSSAVDALQALDLWIHHGVDPEWANSYAPTPTRDKRRPEPESSLLPEPGVYQHPGYGQLLIEKKGESLTARFQTAAPTPIQASRDGAPRLYLSEYDVDFPLRAASADRIRIPFEPALESIVFEREERS